MEYLERVSKSRQLLEGKFPYPAGRQCIRYAIQEMAEYDDALMRLMEPEHKRNNERTPDHRKELGQAIYMAASALLLLPKEYEVRPTIALSLNTEETFGMVVHHLGLALTYSDGFLFYISADVQYALSYMRQLCTRRGWDIDLLVEETCQEFERKWGAEGCGLVFKCACGATGCDAHAEVKALANREYSVTIDFDGAAVTEVVTADKFPKMVYATVFENGNQGFFVDDGENYGSIALVTEDMKRLRQFMGVQDA
jgi:hypothetical protein